MKSFGVFIRESAELKFGKSYHPSEVSDEGIHAAAQKSPNGVHVYEHPKSGKVKLTTHKEWKGVEKWKHSRHVSGGTGPQVTADAIARMMGNNLDHAAREERRRK